MSFDPDRTQRETLAWYLTLAALPGWKAHAWHQAQKLASEHPVLFAELPAQLTAAMQQKSSGARLSGGG